MSTETVEAPRSGEVDMTETLDEEVPTSREEPGDAFLAELDARRSPDWRNKRRRRKGNVMDRRASAAEAVVEDVMAMITSSRSSPECSHYQSYQRHVTPVPVTWPGQTRRRLKNSRPICLFSFVTEIQQDTSQTIRSLGSEGAPVSNLS